MTHIDDLADRYWTLYHENDMSYALWEGDLDYVERWDDFSEEGAAEYRRSLLAIAAEADAADDHGDLGDRITLDTVARSARCEAASRLTVPELQAPNPVVGVYDALQSFLPGYTLVTEDHGERYLQKLRNAEGAVAQLVDALERGRERGWVPNELHVRMMIDKLDRGLSVPLEDDRLGSQPAPKEWSGAPWEATVRGLVGDVLRPALARYRDALAEVTLPVARPVDRPGLCHVPDGDEVYTQRLTGYTTLDVTPEEVHARGLEQVERLNGEYRQLGSETFGTSDLSAVYERLRSDSSLHYQDADSLIAAATAMFRRAEEAAPRWFHVTPESGCEVRPTTTGAMAYYSGPGLEVGKPAAFYFNVADPTVWGPQLAATTFHEGIPGHHFDLARSIENEDLREIHRKMYVAAYNEGWALYSERVADEMGLYEGGLERLGMLMGDSLRACRLVVDTGIHALGWSRDRAIGFMEENSPLPRGEIVPEIDRYIGDPGQACAYMMGRLAIEDARRSAEDALGDSFELADFHEAVLGHGTVSLDAMRWSVDAWVAAAG